MPCLIVKIVVGVQRKGLHASMSMSAWVLAQGLDACFGGLAKYRHPSEAPDAARGRRNDGNCTLVVMACECQQCDNPICAAAVPRG